MKRLTLVLAMIALGACTQKTASRLPPLPETSATPQSPRVSGAVLTSQRRDQPLVALGGGRAVSPAMRQAALASAEPMTLNFVDADVREIARTILGEGLKVPYTIDPLVRGTATIRSEKPLEGDQLLSTLQTLLAQNGATLVVQDGLYRVTPINTNGASGPVLGEGDVGAGTVMVPLAYASARDLAKVLEPFVGVGGKVAADPSRNVLLVSGEPTARAGLVDLIRMFDTDVLRRQSYAVFPVSNGDASAAANDLAQIMGAAGEGPLSGVVRVTPLKRANAVLVVAPQPQYITQARRLFSMVDRARDASARTWHVYFVQNGQVSDLERVLQRAFIGERAVGTSAEAQGQTAPGLESSIFTSPGMAQGGGTGSMAGAPIMNSGTGGAGTVTNTPVQGTGQVGSGAALATGAANPLEPPSVLAPTTEPLSQPTGDAGQGAENRIRIIGNRANNALLIYSTPEEQQTIEAMLRKIDILPLQVRIDATIAEVTLNDNLRYGTQFFFQNAGIATTLSGLTSGAIVGDFPGFVLSRGTGSARFAISALQDVSDVRVLSAPQIVATDNQPAFLQVGDTVPYISQTAVSTQNPDAPIVNSIQYRDTGVILQVTPRVNSGGLVSLDIAQEVSDVTPTTTSGIDSPTFPQRRLKSRVVVEDGQTIGMAGLIRDTNTEGNAGIPVLKNIPIFGALFGTQDNTRRRTELLVMITPHVIHDQRDARALTEDLRQTLQQPALVPDQLNNLPPTGSANPNAAVGAPSAGTVVVPPRRPTEPTSALAPSALVAPVRPAPPGSAGIEIATTDNEAQALTASDAATRRNGDLLRGLTPRIEAANVDGAAKWRVRFVGLPDLKRADELCAKLRERGQQCSAFE
jgi:general secretion pathway protein D